MSMVRKSILFDVTWFLSRPLRTGIQRCIHQIAAHCPDDLDLLPVAIDESSHLNVIDPGLFDVLNKFFSCDNPILEAQLATQIKTFADKKILRLGPDDIAASDGLLLPEATFGWNQIWFHLEMMKLHPDKLFYLSYDFIPWLHPHHFPDLDCTHHGIYGYIRLLRQARNIAFISDFTRQQFEQRVRRGPVPNSLITACGSNALVPVERKAAPAVSEFVFVGSVQRRKQHSLVLDVFESLWDSGVPVCLTFIGGASDTGQPERDRFKRALETRPLFSWEQDMVDSELSEILSTATATLYPSTEEGFGIPPLESLWAGVPAIVSHDLPSLAFTPKGKGYVEIDVSFDTLKAAVVKLLDPSFNEMKRSEIDRSALPTWQRMAETLFGWIRSSSALATKSATPAPLPEISFSQRLDKAHRVANLMAKSGTETEFINDCFEALFERRPTGGEVAAWIEILANCSMDRSNLLFFMLATEEYQRTHSQREMLEWISGKLLKESLGEKGLPSRPEQVLQPESILLDKCVSTIQTLLGIAQSAFVQESYRLLLNREPDQGGRQGFDNLIANAPNLDTRKSIILDMNNSSESMKNNQKLQQVYINDLLSFDSSNNHQLTLYRDLSLRKLNRILTSRILDLEEGFHFFAHRFLLGKQPAGDMPHLAQRTDRLQWLRQELTDVETPEATTIRKWLDLLPCFPPDIAQPVPDQDLDQLQA